ncbi:MAG TPA: hypothetical protein V6C63_15300 [Allocoleopsis sp.]
MIDCHNGWGGARPGAGNPEFKPKWRLGKTTVIRVPEAIAAEILAVARQIDEGELDKQSGCLHRQSVTQPTQPSEANLKEEIRRLQAEIDRLQSSTNLPDPVAILNQLKIERKKSKADLKDVELIIELMQAIAL